MSDNTIIIIVAAIPTTIAAIGALVVSVVNARKSEVIASKVDAVHVLTNSNLSAVTSALQVANEKISGLEAMIAEIKTKNEPVKKDFTAL